MLNGIAYDGERNYASAAAKAPLPVPGKVQKAQASPRASSSREDARRRSAKSPPVTPRATTAATTARTNDSEGEFMPVLNGGKARDPTRHEVAIAASLVSNASAAAAANSSVPKVNEATTKVRSDGTKRKKKAAAKAKAKKANKGSDNSSSDMDTDFDMNAFGDEASIKASPDQRAGSTSDDSIERSISDDEDNAPKTGGKRKHAWMVNSKRGDDGGSIEVCDVTAWPPHVRPADGKPCRMENQ